MSNMPDINKRVISVQISLKLCAKIRLYAEEHKMKFADAVRFILDKGLESVELTSADYEWIAEQVRINEAKLKGAAHE